jgi:ribosomal protein S30
VVGDVGVEVDMAMPAFCRLDLTDEAQLWLRALGSRGWLVRLGKWRSRTPEAPHKRPDHRPSNRKNRTADHDYGDSTVKRRRISERAQVESSGRKNGPAAKQSRSP